MKKIVGIVLLLCAVLVGGCFNDSKKQEISTESNTKQEVKQINFIVYRAAADGREILLPEKVTMDDNGKSLPENALLYLVNTKPKSSDMETLIPAGTKVLDFKIKEETAFVNFSKEIAKKGMGSYDEFMLCYSITNTLTEFPEIKAVQILVEGKKVVSLSGHMDLDDPLTRNTSLLKK